MPDVAVVRAQARRLLLRHRRLASALLAALTVLVVVQAVAPASPAEAGVVVAAHDVTAGTVLSSSDVRVAQVPRSMVPMGSALSLRDVVGQVASGPMRAGEPVTDWRVLGRSVLTGFPSGLVAAPVRIQDAAVADLLQPGDLITVFAAGGNSSYAVPVVDRARLVTVPHVADDGDRGGLLVLAVTAHEASALAQAAATAPLSVALLR